MITLRDETPRDAALVRRVNELAFGQPDEARLVERLHASCDDLISLVATDGEDGVGHILFSPVTLTGADGSKVAGMGLAPMAVVPEHQGKGVGSALVLRGLELLAERDCPYVIVLGHPNYYPRFGFVPASQHGMTCQWEGVPDDAFMVLVLDADGRGDLAGVAHYLPEFDDMA